MWVPPFGYPRIKGYLLLPVAFRSLSRLSSALSAKASTLRSFLLDLVQQINRSVKVLSSSFEKASSLFPPSVASAGVLLLDRIHSDHTFELSKLLLGLMFDVLYYLSVCSFQRTCYPFKIRSQRIRFFVCLAATYLPVPSPAEYFRPSGS